MKTSVRTPLTFSEFAPGEGLRAALALKRSDVLDAVRASGLRGRGGAGFPTATKWTLAAVAQSPEKFVVCNADEGEPGTFKDRVILADFPDLVFDGMTIAAYAIGASRGIVYLRGEYAYLRPLLLAAIERLRGEGRLGTEIGGRKGFDFEVEIRMGSGAYICGEETALIESLEGQRGEPRNRPPFPVDTGFHGRPTVVNNVETLAWASCILARGAEWFRSRGTEKSTGMKLFSVSGDCRHPGIYEFPMGITVGALLLKVGGLPAKAAQIGGAAGRCIPASMFDHALAYEDISTGGSVIVFGPGRDMLEAAKNFMEFFVEESCGQCTPCRIGNRKLLQGIEMLERGECSPAYLRELQRLGDSVRLASKCGLGQSSPNAFLSIIQHFHHEWPPYMPRMQAAAGRTP